MTDRFSGLRKVLETKRDELEQRLSAIARDIRHESRPIERDFEEQASDNENDEVLAVLSASGRQELEAVYRALTRLDKGEYGICSTCGASISLERLNAIPYAELCINCAE